MIYKVNMSKGSFIHIDDEDLEKIKVNIKAPLVQVKQGIINPSFMISIVPDPEIEEVKVYTKAIHQDNGTVRLEEVEKKFYPPDLMNKKTVTKQISL